MAKDAKDTKDSKRFHSLQRDWGPLVLYKPVVSRCSRYLLVPSGNAVKVFSIKSGYLLQEHHHHENKVVGVFPTLVTDEYVSCDENGTVCFWSTQKNTDIKKFILKLEKEKSTVVSFVVCNKLRELFLLRQCAKSEIGSLVKFCLPHGCNHPQLMSKDVLVGPNKISLSSTGDYVVHISPKGLVVLGNGCSFGGKKRIRHLVGDRYLTCVAYHPSQDIIATGDNTGRIILWYEAFSFKTIKKELHWHELPVADLAFSCTGNELYSGGGEAVLLKWSLSGSERYFLPRLGMPIKFVATDVENEYVFTAHSDNALSTISAKAYTLVGTIQGLSMNTETKKNFTAGIAYDHRSRAIVLNGRIGHVQFYDVHHSRQLYHLDITMSNYYSQERHQEIPNTDVERIAVSPDGYWLATVEYRKDFQASFELRLKFWNFSEEDQSWYLNTSIDKPHDKYVNEIIFQPTPALGSTSLCISCGDDGKFKIWKMVDTSDIYGKNSAWNCCGVGFYRHLPATAVRMSPDNSLIAASFGNILTFWQPQFCHLKGTLSQPYLTEKIQQIEFGDGESHGSQVITRSEHWVCSWDLFTCTLSWRVSFRSTCLAADPLSSYMVIFSAECDVLVFEPRSSELVSWQQNICKSPAVSAAFIPRLKKFDSSAPWNEQSTLIYITEDQTLQVLEVGADISSANDRIAGCVKKLVQDTEARPTPTPFAALVAQTHASHASEKSSVSVSAAFGVQQEKSAGFIQNILNEARVYRLDSFAHLTSEFCKMIIPEAVTSEEKQVQDDLNMKLEEREEFQRTRKKTPKRKKKGLKSVIESDFSDLMNIFAL